MASLWLTSVPNNTTERPLATLKAIRQALRAFDPDAGIEAAEAILETLQEEGCAHLGDSDDDPHQLTPFAGQRFSAIRADLMAAGCGTAVDLDPSQIEPPAAPLAESDEVVPGDAAYKTAMVLMANLEGNPLKAASVAISLARTTGAVDFYTEVVASMILSFPWLHEMLKQQKLLS